MTNLFTPPATEVEREGPGGVHLPVLRYQLLVGLLAIGSLLAACELLLCLLLCLPVLRGGELPQLWRWLAVEPFALLSWLALGSLVLFALTAVLFLAWLQRARRNARALGMPARTPGALLWWFAVAHAAILLAGALQMAIHANLSPSGAYRLAIEPHVLGAALKSLAAAWLARALSGGHG